MAKTKRRYSLRNRLIGYNLTLMIYKMKKVKIVRNVKESSKKTRRFLSNLKNFPKLMTLERN